MADEPATPGQAAGGLGQCRRGKTLEEPVVRAKRNLARIMQASGKRELAGSTDHEPHRGLTAPLANRVFLCQMTHLSQVQELARDWREFMNNPG